MTLTINEDNIVFTIHNLQKFIKPFIIKVIKSTGTGQAVIRMLTHRK
jgi:hypothetical protein